MKPPSLSLTTKMVSMLLGMGMAIAMVTAYATWHMQQMALQHEQLWHQHTTALTKVQLLRQHLGDSSALVHKALSASGEEQMLLSQEHLTVMQQAFREHLTTIYPLLPEQGLALDYVRTQSQQMFAAGQHVLTARLHQQDTHAFLALNHSFSPALDTLQQEVDALRTDTAQILATAAHTLTHTSHRALTHTRLIGWLGALLLSVGAIGWALRHVTRPVERLAATVQRLTLESNAPPPATSDTTDAIAVLTRSVHDLATALQGAQQLAHDLAQPAHNHLLIEQLLQLTSALPGAVFQMQLASGTPLRLCFASPQWAQLMGVAPGADTSLMQASEIIFNHDPHATSIAVNHFTESASTLAPVDFEVSMVMLDGVTRWIKTRANPHRESDGSVTFNGVWLDVSKEVLQSRALKKAKRHAEQSAAERSTLQASISHEIRTPLNAILGLTQLLLKADLPTAQREQLHNVLRAGQHLRGIVNEVLDFSKIDAGQLKLESTDFSLENVVLDVLSMCREEASKKGLSLHYTMAREVPDSLRGDPHRIAQILLNYVNNAIKFTTSGHIDIALRLDTSSTLHRIVLHASVTDTGPGIPADHLPMLFEAFQQADNSITRRFGGTGLGLTISRALAQLMGGSAGVHSTLGQGSSFWFTAVLEPARTPVPQAPLHALPQPPAPDTHPWQGLRILVVDDNPLNRAVAEGMLQAHGLQTETAEDGAQALRTLQAQGPHYFDCVLMDIQMPHMDGLSATQALRKLPGFERLPVIAMTAHSAVQDVAHTHAAGMNDHLSKPLLESALLQTLHTWLGSPPPSPAPTQASAAAPVDAAKADLPPVFDPAAMDALAQLFDHAKLQQLVAQFTNDSLQRARQLPALAAQQDWHTMRAEAHKLTGTAATFGLLRLGHLSSALTTALRAADAEHALQLAQQVAQSAQMGMVELQAYYPTPTPQT